MDRCQSAFACVGRQIFISQHSSNPWASGLRGHDCERGLERTRPPKAGFAQTLQRIHFDAKERRSSRKKLICDLPVVLVLGASATHTLPRRVDPVRAWLQPSFFVPSYLSIRCTTRDPRHLSKHTVPAKCQGETAAISDLVAESDSPSVLPPGDGRRAGNSQLDALLLGTSCRFADARPPPRGHAHTPPVSFGTSGTPCPGQLHALGSNSRTGHSHQAILLQP